MADPTDMREYADRIAPIWLKNYWGSRYIGGAIGLPMDAHADGAQRALLSRSLLWTDVPADAIARQSVERMLPGFPGETSSAHAQRLVEAWEAWSYAGSPYGVESMFSAFGVTGTVVEQNIDGWDWDGDTAWWSRSWIVVTNHGWIADGVWGDPGIWDDGGTWGSDATFEEIEAMRTISRTMKKFGMVFQYIIIVLDPGNWSPPPDGTWDNWGNRDTGAIYVDG